MRSRGGIVSAALAAQQPVTLFLSGPAGGVIGAAFAAERSGVRDFVSLDMGGTSNDVAMVRDGKPLLASEGAIGPYPVRTPMVDVNTIGAGGGSIAWIDAAGGLRVGPRSAGADPGPACYGRGGDEATVTDASVVLGYLNPARFAGGTLALDAAAAERAVAAVGDRLGRGRRRPPPPASTAWSTRAWPTRSAWSRSSAATIRGSSRWWCSAARVRCTARRSRRRWAWPRCSCPRRRASSRPSASWRPPSSTSMRARSQARADVADLDAVNRCLARARRRRARADARGGRGGRRRCAWRTPPTCATSARRTSWRCRSGCRSRASGCADVLAAFHAVARARLRLRAHAAAGGVRELPRRAHLPVATAGGDAGRARDRHAGRRAPGRAPRVLRADGFVPTAIYERARLPLGARLPGPAIVEQSDTTTVIPPGVTALRGRRRATCALQESAMTWPSTRSCSRCSATGSTPSPTRWS